MKFKLLRTPSVDLSIALIAGILVGKFSGFTTYGLFILALLSALLYTVSHMPQKKFKLLPVLFAIAGFALTINAQNIFSQPKHISSFVSPKKVVLSGKVKTGFKYFPGGYRFYMEAEKIKSETVKSETNGLIRVSVFGGDKPPLPGDSITISNARLKAVSSFRNFGGFDYKQFMEKRGIAVAINLRDEKMMKIEIGRYPIDPKRGGEILRRAAKSYIEDRFPESIVGIASAMSIGITGGVDHQLRRSFAVSGLAHLLAISGLHVGFVTAFAYFAFYWFFYAVSSKLKPVWGLSGLFRKPAVILALFTGLIFVLSTGTRVSAVRAGIMVAIYLLSAIIDREKEPLNALAISALLILLFDPMALFSASFQMSYIAVLAIVILFAEREEEEDELLQLEPKGKLEWLRLSFESTVKISIVVGLAVAPIVMAHFSEVHLGGFLANIVAVPLASIAVPATLIGAFLNSFSQTVGNIVAWPAIIAFGGIKFTAEFFSKINLFSFTGPPMPPALIALYYATLAFWFVRNRMRYFATALLAIFLTLYYINWPRDKTEVHFFDVGQGDSALIMLKSGENILIDGGVTFGQMDIGSYVTAPALNKLKVRKLDAVIATHDHNDHAGGLATILNRIKTTHYYDNGIESRNQIEATQKKLRQICADKGIATATLRAGIEIPFAGGIIKTIHPDKQYAKDFGKDINNSSLALMLEVENVKVLFMSDIEKDAEKYLIAKNAALDADIIKIAHHGSRTGTTARFLNTVSPKLAIISVAKINRWRHPSIEVVRRLKKREVAIKATDDEGEIIILINNGEASSFSFVNRRPKKIDLR